MGSKFAVVYGTVSKVIRRIIETEDDPDDSYLNRARTNLAPGESIIIFDYIDFPLKSKRRKANFHPHIGEPSHRGRCVQIDQNNVVINVIQADPIIDKIFGHTLIQHDQADIGWIYHMGELLPKKE